MGKSRLNRRDFFQQATGTAGVTVAASAVHLGLEPLAAAPRPARTGETTSSEPAKWKDLLSKPEYEIRTLIDVKATMRDGVKLSANVFLPKKEGRWPVILERSPYGAKGIAENVNRALYYAKRGYVYVLQDVRGRFDSEGEWHPWDQEINDGRDSLDWCGTQSWSSGKVGMMGMSYCGLVQWLAAPTGSPYLKTIIPHACAADLYMYGMNYTGGAFMHYINLPWAMRNGAQANQPSILPYTAQAKQSRALAYSYNAQANEPSTLPYDWDKAHRLLPILTAEEVLTGRPIKFYHEWVLHSTYDDYWKQISNFGKYAKMDLPILQVVGWFDCYIKSLIANYEGIQREGMPLAIREQKVIIGPWVHTDKPERKYGDMDFGADSVIDLDEIFLRWMDRWLKGTDNGVEQEPPLRLFTMGTNRWRTAEKWPLPETVWTKLYLHSGGRANSSFGNGKLSGVIPDESEPSDNFVYNPEDPVPTLGSDPNGQILPLDHRPVETRDDVLVYTTEPFQEDLEVTGPVQARLYASSSATDTDWTVNLLDVYPEGQAVNLCDGIIRGRFREPAAIRTGVPAAGQYERPKLMEPGKVYQFTIEVGAISNVFLKGHRVRIEVSSSNFPHFDRNLNNGGQLGVDRRIVVAKQIVYHTRRYPSHVELPVIPATKAV